MIEEQSYKRTQRLYLSEQVRQKARNCWEQASWPICAAQPAFPEAPEAPEGPCKMHMTAVGCIGSEVLNTQHLEENYCA